MASTNSYVSLPDTTHPSSLASSLLPAVSSSPSDSFQTGGSEPTSQRSLLQKLHPYRYYLLILACTVVVFITLLGVVLSRESDHYGNYVPTNSTGSGGGGNGGRPGPPSGPGGDTGNAPGGGPGGDGGDTGSGEVGTNSSCTQAKILTEGPYWIDEKLNRSDLYSTASGQMLSLEVLVYNTSIKEKCVPIPNAMIDLWTSDAAGLYSDEQVLGTKGKTFLRGFQMTNKDGVVSFLTIWPGWYQGRTVHMHLRVRILSADGKTVILNQTTQLFLDDPTSDAIFSAVAPYNTRTGKRDTYNKNDNLYSSPMLINTTGSIKDGFHGSFALGVPFLR